jgi:hypothetical protein
MAFPIPPPGRFSFEPAPGMTSVSLLLLTSASIIHSVSDSVNETSASGVTVIPISLIIIPVISLKSHILITSLQVWVQFIFIKFSICMSWAPCKQLPKDLAISNQLFSRVMIEHRVFYGINMNQNPKGMDMFNTSTSTEMHQIMLPRVHLMREQGEKDCLRDP